MNSSKKKLENSRCLRQLVTELSASLLFPLIPLTIRTKRDARSPPYAASTAHAAQCASWARDARSARPRRAPPHDSLQARDVSSDLHSPTCRVSGTHTLNYTHDATNTILVLFLSPSTCAAPCPACTDSPGSMPPPRRACHRNHCTHTSSRLSREPHRTIYTCMQNHHVSGKEKEKVGLCWCAHSKQEN
jgi:hypothetical protein